MITQTKSPSQCCMEGQATGWNVKVKSTSSMCDDIKTQTMKNENSHLAWFVNWLVFQTMTNGAWWMTVHFLSMQTNEIASFDSVSSWNQSPSTAQCEQPAKVALPCKNKSFAESLSSEFCCSLIAFHQRIEQARKAFLHWFLECWHAEREQGGFFVISDSLLHGCAHHLQQNVDLCNCWKAWLNDTFANAAVISMDSCSAATNEVSFAKTSRNCKGRLAQSEKFSTTWQK